MARASLASGRVLLAAIAAAVIAVVVYYAHFVDVYRTEPAHRRENGHGRPDAGGARHPRPAGIGSSILGAVFRRPLARAGGMGGSAALASARARSHQPDRYRLAPDLRALFALGILTPVDMRYYLAAIPAIVLFAAGGAAIAWTSSGPPVQSQSLGWRTFSALRSWWITLG